MQTPNIDYQEERVYAGTRLIILFIFTLASFLITTEMIPKIPLVRLVLGGLILLSIMHNAFIAYRPDMLVSLRKNALILVDLLAVTLFILIFEKYGIYLFAFYVLIVMQSSLYFGTKYTFTSLFSAIVSWVLLFVYSLYWHEHYNVIIAFAVTTFLTSLFALRFIRSTVEIYNEPAETVILEQPEIKHTFLDNIPNRDMYKETIGDMIKRKESFNLLFISLDKFKTITDKHGFEIGERVMEEAAKRLEKSINEDDFFARLGAREFVIISKLERASLRKFLKKLEENTIGACSVEGINVLIKINIGVSLSPENGQTVMAVGKCADDALRAAEKSPSLHHILYGSIKSAGL
jgi:diguanylate cyclase (GGDEF)-like protein